MLLDMGGGKLDKMSPIALSSASRAMKEASLIGVFPTEYTSQSPNDRLLLNPAEDMNEFIVCVDDGTLGPRLAVAGGPIPDDPRESADGARPPRADPVKLEPVLLKPLVSEIVDIVDPEESSVGVKFLPKATSSGCPDGYRIPGCAWRSACACRCWNCMISAARLDSVPPAFRMP